MTVIYELESCCRWR